MATPFDPTVEIAPGADLTTDPSTWSWHDYTDHALAGPAITITRGRRDRYAQTAPAQARLSLRNPDGLFCPDNPMSELYGLLDVNTPLRISNRPTTNTLLDAFGRTSASSWGSADTGGAWTNTGGAGSDYSVSTTNGGRHLHTAAASSHYSTLASLSIVRSDVRVRVRVNALSTGASQTAGITVRWQSASANRRAEVRFNVGGTLTGRLIIREGGADTVVSSATATPTHTAATWYWIRLQTGLTSARMKVWADGTDEPRTWLLDGEDGFFANPAAGYCGVYSIRETGNTNANATIDFDDFSMVDGPRIQFTGYVDSWPTTWMDESESVQLAPITASGRLKQINQAKNLKSALHRAATMEAFSGAPLAVAYWPMEDGSNATLFGSGLASGTPMLFNDARPAGTAMPGSDPLPTFGGEAWFYGLVPAYATSTMWSVRALMKFDAAPSVNSGVLAWAVGGTLSTVAFVINTAGTWAVHGYVGTSEVFGIPSASFVDANGTTLVGQPFYMAANAVQNGANIDWSVTLWTAAGGTGLTGSYAGTLGNVQRVYHSAYPGYTAGDYTIGHVAVGNDTNLLVGGDQLASGYAGELASTRFGRLTAEENIPAYFGDIFSAPGSTTQEMGAQRTTSLIAQLREVEATEHGILHDGKQGQLTLLPRVQRQNRAVDLTLSRTAREISAYQPVIDDALLRNDIRVTNASGATAVAQDTAANIRRRGVRPDAAAINARYDSHVQLHADWRLNVGKTVRRRWPGIVINLARDQGLIEDWLDCDIGSRMQLTNLPAPPFYDGADLHIEGYTEVFGSFSWEVTIDTSPAEPWNVFELDDPVLGWMHTSGSELGSGINSSATSLSVVTPTGPVWPTAASPFDIMIGGERMTVIAVSGTSTPQTFTVTRSVNGVVKSHLAAAAVVHYGSGVLGL